MFTVEIESHRLPNRGILGLIFIRAIYSLRFARWRAKALLKRIRQYYWRVEEQLNKEIKSISL